MNNLTMADAILPQIDTGAMLHNLSMVTFSRAQKRWRLAYFSIRFSNTLRSFSKIPKKLTYCPVPVASHTESEINTNFTNANANTEEFCIIDQSALTNLMKNKDLDMLRKFNGVEGLAKSLHTTLENGLNGQDIERSKIAFGSNICSKPSPKPLWSFVAEAFNNPTIVILLLSAALFIDENAAKERWGEGLKILASLGMILVVSSVTSFSQERQFDRLSKKSNNTKIDAIREGRRQKVLVSDVVVGDIVILSVGDQIPADGLFISGHSLLINESRMAAETKDIHVDGINTTFLFSGSKVADGYARMLVISVGVDTALTTSDSNEITPLQSRLGKLTHAIGKVGLTVSTLVLVIMLIRHFTGYARHQNGKWDYQQQLTDTLDKLNSFTRTLIATAQDIPLAVALTLAYCRKRMMGNRVMVRKLSACETMGSTTVICTGKTGTLTTNQMEVGKFWVGLVHIEDDSSIRTIDAKVLELYHQGVGLNTTGSIYNSETTPEYSGSPTEKAILAWAVTNLAMDPEKLNQNYKILDVETFNSEKKRSMVSIRKKEDNSEHVHWKGAAEMGLAICSSYYDRNGVVKSIDPEKRVRFEKIIRGMAASRLRCIAFAHKEKDDTRNEEGLILLGIVGIKDHCRLGAVEAVKSCCVAGVDIKMITGDNVFTAKAIATDCGILKVGHQGGGGKVVITGEEFRNYTDEQRMQRVDSIRVMARSSPFDKLLMVQCLKKKGHVVAVTGHDTNDACALKEADIGLSMGLQGTEVVKESSDIVILDDDISSIVVALRWGRCVYKNIQKFVQFQLTVNIAALAINFIATACATDAPLTVVQLLWVNIIMDTLGAIALATECPDIELMYKPPVDRGAPIVTNVMCRNILVQALYQIVLLSTFQFRGRSIFNVNEKVKNTVIFNTFVLCQVFNEFNSRKPENRNVLEGLYKNHIFLSIIGMTIIIQVVIVEYLNNFADTEKLNKKQWGICITFAALSLPIGLIAKFIPVPNTPFLSYIQRRI